MLEFGAHFCKLRRPVFRDIEDVYPAGSERRHDESVPVPGGVVEAGGAGVPASVVDLVVQVGQLVAVDHLRGNGT